MRIKYLAFQCGNNKCNGIIVPMFVGLVEGYKLRIEGYCIECGNLSYMDYPLERLITECPGGSTTPFRPIRPPLKTKDDAEFLRELGIDPNDKEAKDE